jgi:hypothetical protein
MASFLGVVAGDEAFWFDSLGGDPHTLLRKLIKKSVTRQARVSDLLPVFVVCTLQPKPTNQPRILEATQIRMIFDLQPSKTRILLAILASTSPSTSGLKNRTMNKTTLASTR